MRSILHLMLTLTAIWSEAHAIKRLRDKDLSHEDLVIKRLLRNYRHKGKLARPVKYHNDTVTIHFAIQLVQILDLDEKNQVLTLNVWDRYTWSDIYLRWDPAEYGGVKEIRLPPSEIWIPDVKLYNYADLRLNEHRDALCVVQHTGDVLWMPQAVYKSSCALDVSKFPFDIQNCKLKFGSWTHNGFELDLALPDNASQINMENYIETPAWEILEYPAVRNSEKYDCCEAPFVDITFTLIFQRTATVYNYLLVLPCVLLTSLTLVLFWIPPESPAKMQLGMNIFVAFFVLMLLLEENLPPAADEMPLLGVYYCLNMSLITLSSFLSVFVVNLTFYGTRAASSVPMAIKHVFFRVVARFLGMGSLVKPHLNDSGLSCPPNGIAFRGVTENKWTREFTDSGDLLYQKLQERQDVGDRPDGALLHIYSTIKDIDDFLKSYRERLCDKDRKERMAKEWKVLALVVDRLFFCLYMITIITSLTIVLYKVAW